MFLAVDPAAKQKHVDTLQSFGSGLLLRLLRGALSMHYLRTALATFLLLSINLSSVENEVVEPEGIDWVTICCSMRVGVNHHQNWRSNPDDSVVDNNSDTSPPPFLGEQNMQPLEFALLFLFLMACLCFAVLRLNTDLLGSTSNSANAPQIAAGL